MTLLQVPYDWCVISLSLSYKKIVKFLNVKEDSKGFGLSGENALHRSVINGELECGPMPNVMVALPNIGVALCSTPQSLADAYYFTAV